MIGQLLGDAAGWCWENPWRVAAGFVVWMVASVGLAFRLGPAMADNEHEELELVVSPW